MHKLKHQGPRGILTQLDLLSKQHPENEILIQNRAYLEKRETQMQYPHYQRQNWPIGSGMVESANKLVVEARLKGSGMHWKRECVDPMLALRNLICSDRWAQEGPKIAHRLRQQVAQRKKSRRHLLLQEKQLTPELPPPNCNVSDHQPKISPKPIKKSLPKKASTPWKPAANHPWRRSPIGRARYQSSKK